MRWAILEENIPSNFWIRIQSFLSFFPFFSSVPNYHREMRNFINLNKQSFQFPINKLPDLIKIFDRHQKYKPEQYQILSKMHRINLEGDDLVKLFECMQTNNPLTHLLFGRLAEGQKHDYMEYLIRQLNENVSCLDNGLSIILKNCDQFTLADRFKLILTLHDHQKHVQNICQIVTAETISDYIINYSDNRDINELLLSNPSYWYDTLLSDAYVTFFRNDMNRGNLFLDKYFNQLCDKKDSTTLTHILIKLLDSKDEKNRRRQLETFFIKIKDFDLSKVIVGNLMQNMNDPTIKKAVVDILLGKINALEPYQKSQLCYLIGCDYSSRSSKNNIYDVKYEDYCQRDNDLMLDREKNDSLIPLLDLQHLKVIDFAINHRQSWVSQQIHTLNRGIRILCSNFLSSWNKFMNNDWLNRQRDHAEEITHIVDSIPPKIDKATPDIRSGMKSVQELYLYKKKYPIFKKIEISRESASLQEQRQFDRIREARKDYRHRVMNGMQFSVSKQRLKELFPEEAKQEISFKRLLKQQQKLGVNVFDAEDLSEKKTAVEEAQYMKSFMVI